MPETPAETPLFELWTSLLSCGCWSPPMTPDGHIYGPAKPGGWVSCVSKLGHQAQYKVLETLPAEQLARSGYRWTHNA